MIDRQTLAKWARPPEGADRYLRPFVCRGELQRGEAAIVGPNPATEIGPHDVRFSEYLDLLVDLERFTEFYHCLRVGRGKRASSPTRTGIDGMANWLASLGWECILDTNVSPYPTASGEDMAKVPDKLQSRWVFEEVVQTLRPSLIILHGEGALRGFTSDVAPGLAPREPRYSALVERSPYLGQCAWAGRATCEVYVCPHLRFFEHRGGARFSALKSVLPAA